MVQSTLDVSGLPEVTFDKGHTLFAEGKPGSRVYVLKQGQVAIVAGGTEICKVDAPLTIFGEISILLDTAASASVILEKSSTFYEIGDLSVLVKERPATALHICRILAQRVVDMNKYYVQIKSELVKVQANPSNKLTKKLWDVVVKMDRFWGREVL